MTSNHIVREIFLFHFSFDLTAHSRRKWVCCHCIFNIAESCRTSLCDKEQALYMLSSHRQLCLVRMQFHCFVFIILLYTGTRPFGVVFHCTIPIFSKARNFLENWFYLKRKRRVNLKTCCRA